MKMGAIKGLGIGYNTVKRTFKGPVRHLQELALGEFSPGRGSRGVGALSRVPAWRRESCRRAARARHRQQRIYPLRVQRLCGIWLPPARPPRPGLPDPGRAVPSPVPT
jgi:hypothetical protein